MKHVLMVAFHFPPHAGSSGIQRTLRFVRHLPEHGWSPLLLSAHPMAYERTSDDLVGDIPEGTIVRRAFALNSARHLAIKGRYLAATARPDRWVSWKYDAIRQGMQMIEAYKPDLIWSTYPIATAHVIADALHRRSGIPWVADFRDPMAQPGYPADPVTWQPIAMSRYRPSSTNIFAPVAPALVLLMCLAIPPACCATMALMRSPRWMTHKRLPIFAAQPEPDCLGHAKSGCRARHSASIESLAQRSACRHVRSTAVPEVN